MTGPVGLDSHADLAAITPLLAGCDPAGYLFIVALTDTDTIVGTVKTRMADPPYRAYTVRAAAKVCWALLDQEWDAIAKAVVIAYGPAQAADPLIELTVRTLVQVEQIPVFDVIRVEDGRCWSYRCECDEHRPGGAGEPVDPDGPAARQVAAILNEAGQ